MTVTPVEYRSVARSFAPPLRVATVAETAIAALRRAAIAIAALAAPIILLAAWWLAARYELVAAQILPAPAIVWSTAVDLFRSGQLQSELLVSLCRLAAGLVLGGAAGLAIGIAMGLSARLESYLGPMVRAIWLVPSLGWLPLFMLLFGIGEALKIVIIAKACFLPMMVNGFDGVRNVPQKYREVARTLNLGPVETLRFVVLPSILPRVLTGFRLSLSKGWQVLVLVEMIASAAGIGYLMTWGRKSFQLDVVLVTIVVIGVIGWLLDRAAAALQTRAAGWVSRGAISVAMTNASRRGNWRGLVLPALFVLAWIIVGKFGMGRSPLFVSVGTVKTAFLESVWSDGLLAAIGATVLRAFLGWTIGSAAGFVLGLVLGLSNWSRRLVAPTLHSARQIALFAWIPLLSAWLGNGEAMKLALIALSAFFPVLLHVEAGCRDVPVPYREVGRLFGFDRLSEILFVVLPAAAPMIISGLELAFAIAWIGTIGAEYLIGTGYMNASPDGLGAFLAGARENARMDLVIVGILSLGAIGLTLDRLVVLASRRAVAWRR
ncbi:MAG TPA: ABC transporter permease [Xanthobacteraceae bacterium]|jgi:sulfonate transport system permease protein|nr:ABC transporter permease [Xanthobacteraceae bacterium]